MDMEEALHRILREAVDSCVAAGISLLVEKDGKEVCYCEEGMADIEKEKPLRRDGIFRIYSLTKPVTATAIMLLAERGELDLAQPVADILPAFSKTKVWVNGKEQTLERPMLVHDLMRMTSGLVYPDGQSEPGKRTGAVYEETIRRMDTENPVTTLEFAQKLAECPLAYSPGEGWQYGTSADILGAVAEKVSGMEFGEFLNREFFEPLGMKDTGFWVPSSKQERLVSAYETITDGNGSTRLRRYCGNELGICSKMAKKPAYESAGGGLVSTLDDYMCFARMLLQGGEAFGKQFLQKRTVRFLTEAGLEDAAQKSFQKNWAGLEGFSYGNLMRVCKDPTKAGFLACRGEYGWKGWFGTHFLNFPEEKITILVGMQKKNSGTVLIGKLRNVILSSLTV